MQKSKKIPYEVRNLNNLKELVYHGADLYREKTAFMSKTEKGGEYNHISYIQFKYDVEALATKLINIGLADKKIAVIGANSYQWVVSYFAAICIGVVVPLDKELSSLEINNLVQRAECDAIFYDNNCVAKVSELDINLKIQFSDYQNNLEKDGIYKLINEGKKLLDNGDNSFIEKPLDNTVMAALLFTSGTTGTPKGVMLSHKNITRVIMSTTMIITPEEGDSVLSVLPIHHTYESTLGIMTPLFAGFRIAFCEGLKYILKNMKEAQTTYIVGVPIIVETIYSRIWKEAEKTGKAKLLKKVISINKKLMSLGIDKRALLFKSVRKNFGGKFRCVICGAAAINPKVVRGFVDLGFEICQGYGLTETAPLVAGVPQYEDMYAKAGSCGPHIPEVEIAIDNPDEDGIGEIKIKGDNVMLGYYDMPEETEKVLKNGWFYSGDLGFIDKDGWLYLTGRNKNIIVTKTGKNIYPEEIEIIINDIKYVSDSMVYGIKDEQSEEFYTAVQIYPNYEEIKESYGDLDKDGVYNLFKELLYDINKEMPSYKRIRKIIIREDDFIRTTTKKIKRNENI
ncbi:MAG: AMP-binding protein [Eubacteriales bacterium]|nr:AMP-binding protein [Eubacteriales bacterium]MDY3332937.1 AMP-binding protein [Gallibacter sp.]